MRGRHRRLVIPQGQDHQFTLFGPFGTASCTRPGPAWSLLPDETRRAVTGLMVRLHPRTRPRRPPPGRPGDGR